MISKGTILVHFATSILVTQHLQDLLREAEEDRRRTLVRGATRSRSTSLTGRLAGLLHRLPRPGRRGSNAARPAGRRPAAA
ncbi:MAG: hypothetical protein L0227_09150 [Chloroflexi bacterium]|nr:hypothetical protein [Chloroflexota bacterium]